MQLHGDGDEDDRAALLASNRRRKRARGGRERGRAFSFLEHESGDELGHAGLSPVWSVGLDGLAS